MSKWDIIEIDLQEVGCGRMDCIWPGQVMEMGKVGGKRTLNRPKRKCDDIIEIDLQVMGCGRMDCIGVGQNRDKESLGGKSPLSRPRRKWNDIIQIDLQEVGCARMEFSAWVRIGKCGNLEERDH